MGKRNSYFDLYHNLSNFSLYKSRIHEIGVESLLVFNIDGFPFIARDYAENDLKSNRDYIFLSAFISSVLKFIKIEGKAYITDFGIGTSRYFLKFDYNRTVYCLVLSEIIYRRVTGEQLIIFVESIANNLIKLFNTYYVDENGILAKEDFDEQFCLQLDKVFLSHFEQTLGNEYHKLRISTSKNNFFIEGIDLDPAKSLSSRLSHIGVKGLLICGLGGDMPVILRNYDSKQKETVESAYFFCGLSNLLNKFALTNFGFFTDVGFGYKRVIFKFKTENKITLCLILNEILFRRITGETLNMFSELTLGGIHKSIKNKAMDLTALEIHRAEDGSFEEESSVDEPNSKINQSALEQLDSFLMLYATMAISEIE